MAFENPFMPPLGVEYKTVPQTAEILQLNVATVNKYIKQGKLQSIKLGGTRRVLFAASVQDMNYAELAHRANQASAHAAPLANTQKKE